MKPLFGTGPLLAAGVAMALASPVTIPGSATRWQWPLEPVPRVVRGYDEPASPYGPGHRGVDLSGAVGQVVLAVAAGRVSFAGPVAGRGVVVVDHGRLSSTYQPVSGYVSRGDRVSAGQPIGSLELTGSHCLPEPCLHLGAKRGETYLDPLSLLPGRPVRLKPLAGTSSAAAR
jgi:murein DD-endopeptidase MepM/ murein hydrolase activator NlpD